MYIRQRVWGYLLIGIGRERDREREKERETERETEREKERDREIETERDTERDRERQRETEGDREKEIVCFVCLFGFLTSSSTTRLYRGRAPRQSV